MNSVGWGGIVTGITTIIMNTVSFEYMLQDFSKFLFIAKHVPLCFRSTIKFGWHFNHISYCPNDDWKWLLAYNRLVCKEAKYQSTSTLDGYEYPGWCVLNSIVDWEKGNKHSYQYLVAECNKHNCNCCTQCFPATIVCSILINSFVSLLEQKEMYNITNPIVDPNTSSIERVCYPSNKYVVGMRSKAK